MFFATPALVPPSNRRTLRRTLRMATVVAVVGAVALMLAGHPLLAITGCVGILLGALNSWWVQQSVGRYSQHDSFAKGRFAVSVLGRLAVISVLAFGLALLVRPDGLAVFAGLAVFQVLTIISASVPLIKEIRQS